MKEIGHVMDKEVDTVFTSSNANGTSEEMHTPSLTTGMGEYVKRATYSQSHTHTRTVSISISIPHLDL